MPNDNLLFIIGGLLLIAAFILAVVQLLTEFEKNRKANEEVRALQHDIDRYMQITSEQAEEIEAFNRTRGDDGR